jgi:hypothetical protein
MKIYPQEICQLKTIDSRCLTPLNFGICFAQNGFTCFNWKTLYTFSMCSEIVLHHLHVDEETEPEVINDSAIVNWQRGSRQFISGKLIAS